MTATNSRKALPPTGNSAPKTKLGATPRAGAPHRLSLVEVIDALARDGQLAPGEAARAQTQAKISTHPLIALADIELRGPHGAWNLVALSEWCAAWTRLPYLHVDPLKMDFSRIGEVMTSSYASRWRILPVEVTDDAVTIATCEPFLTGWEEELTTALRRSIKRVFINPQDLDRFVVEFFTIAKTVRSAAKQSGGAPTPNGFEQLVDLSSSDRAFDANDQHIVRVVDWLWQYAFDQRASDIHLEPRREQGSIRFRIDGVLHTVYQVPPNVMNAMTSRIKLLGRMDVVEKRRPQDGRIKTRTPAGREIELRLSTLPTAFGEKLVMRIFDPEVLQRDLSELGFPDDEAKRWRALVKRPHGILLVTGPTGSGKTTTLYATLRLVATDAVNVCTVEDPIELVDDRLNQMQVQPGIDLSFADGVRALMRQDPDIIMVGEIRDRETADMAIQAALTGHLVLSTLHTNDSVSAVTRLLDLGVPSYLISATVMGVLAQRLVRTLCPACKADAGPVDDALWSGLTRPFKAPAPQSHYRAVGCLECRNTGYRGRAGLYEMLVTDEAFKSAMAEGHQDLQALRRLAYSNGLKPLRIAGAQKIASGATSVDEVLSVVELATR